MNTTHITSFTQLNTWKSGHALVLETYRLTRQFPKEEIHCLVNQMRRAAISITSNIAEGFGRKNYKEKAQFYYLSHGSLTELENQLLISREIPYLTTADYEKSFSLLRDTQRLLNGLIIRTKQLGQSNKEFIKQND